MRGPQISSDLGATQPIFWLAVFAEVVVHLWCRRQPRSDLQALVGRKSW